MGESPSSSDPEALLAHAGWVRSLARRLVLDPGRADDLEQQAWLGVLEKPPAGAHSLPSWLGGVVRNTARQLGRRESRRRQREEQVPAPDRIPPPTELVEQAEMQREVVSAVLELDEPYRSTMLLRYWRDQSPQEIARIQGVPPGTVRSRIHRAHDELRARLDRRFDGDRGAWSAVLVASIPADFSTKAAAPIGASALFAGAVMGWKLKLGLVVFLGALAAWWILPIGSVEPAGEDPSSSSGPATSSPSGSVSGEAAVGLSSPDSTHQRDPVLERAASIAFRGTVIALDGSPIADATLAVYPNVEDREDEEPLGTGTSDETGSFRIDDYTAGPESFVIEAEADGYRSASMDPAVPGIEIELTLGWRGVLVGQVRDGETGEPLPGATVAWYRDPPATTDANGRYRIPDFSVGHPWPVYARAEGYAEDSAEVELRGPEEATVDFELSRGSPLVVEVFDPETGAPVAGADVHGDPRVVPLTRTDADGRCEVRIIEGRELFLRVVAEDHYPFIWGYRVEDIERVLSPRIPLAPLGAIEGLVTDATGSPLAGIDLHVVREGQMFGTPSLSAEERERLDLPGHAGPDVFHRLNARTDERGTFRVPVLPGSSPVRVFASRPDAPSASSEPVVVESSDQHPWVEIAFREGATIHGRVLFNGEPRPGVGVRWEPTAGGRVESTRSDDDGRYELTDVAPGAVTVYVISSLGQHGALPRAELVVEAGESYERDLSWELALSKITGRVVSDAGSPLADVRVVASSVLDGSGYARFETRTNADGTYEVDACSEVTYDVTASRSFVDQRSRPDVVAGTEDVDFVFAELVAFPVALVDGATGEPLEVRVETRGLSWRESGRDAFQPSLASLHRDGTAELHVPVGIVDLSVYVTELGYAPAIVQGVQVTEGVARPLVIELTRGVEGKLSIVNEVGDRPRGRWLFLLEESQLPLFRGPFPEAGDHSNYSFNGFDLWLGDRGLVNQRFQPDDRGRALVPGLAPGRYTLRALPDDLLFEPETFAITGEESEPIEIRWRPR